KRAPSLGNSKVSWMRAVWECPDQVLEEKIGLDAVVFIKFLRMCRWLFIVLAIVGCCVLIPINVVGTSNSADNNLNGTIPEDKIGLLSIKYVLDPKWLWAHVAMTWTFTLVLFWFFWQAYQSFLDYRIGYFRSDEYQTNMASRTLMLVGLP